MNVSVCGRCGLRAVRRALEGEGEVARFCDFCYWGEAETEDTQTGAPALDPHPAAPAES